jgi:hypothetical protein
MYRLTVGQSDLHLAGRIRDVAVNAVAAAAAAAEASQHMPCVLLPQVHPGSVHLPAAETARQQVSQTVPQTQAARSPSKLGFDTIVLAPGSCLPRVHFA